MEEKEILQKILEEMREIKTTVKSLEINQKAMAKDTENIKLNLEKNRT